MKTTKLKLALGITLGLLTITGGINAQDFGAGDKDLSIGLGFGGYLYYPGDYSLLPEISASFDYGLRDDWGPGVFGVGAFMGISRTGTDDLIVVSGEFGVRYTNVTIAPRATYHYQFVDKLDTYAGALLGLGIQSQKPYGTWPTAEPDTKVNLVLVEAVFVGARYYFTRNFAGFAEVGVGVSYLTLGMTFKM